MDLRFQWKIPVAAAPDRLWRYIADTNRINQYAGLPEFTFKYVPDADGGSRQIGETRYMGWHLVWDEHPFEWIEGQYYEIVREYHNGPVARLHTAVTLRPSDGGSIVEQTITCTPRWSIAVPAIYWEIGYVSRKRFKAAYRKIETYLQGHSDSAFLPVPRQPIPPGRIAVIRNRLQNAGGSAWLPKLIEAIETYPDEELDIMRPFVLADRWNADRREVLKLFLHASQAGLVDLSWDVVCPGCRGASERLQSLRRLRTEAHCPACNVRYSSNFAESVEVTFRPNPGIRRIDVARYCSGGPMNAPHIVAQQQISARKSKTLSLRLSPWKYNVRSLKLKDQTFLRIQQGATKSSATIRIRRPNLEPDTLDLSPDVSLTIENTDDRDIMVILERVAGNENAATAATVIAMSEFRSIFSEEVLNPDTPVSVGAVTLMFTDLRASTSLYERIGEARAYGLVRRHFDLLRDQIAKCDGALVKTIGDSVMAAFIDPARAVEAAFEMLKTIDDDNSRRGDPELNLKIGIHHGPCIAVNLNEILDYFGTTANIAARVQKECEGGDIVITEEVWEDPKVREVLARYSNRVEGAECVLKGISGTRRLRRVKPVS